MRRALLLTVLLVLAGGARAQDFTGFYAGLNAGFARGSDGGRTGAAPGSLPPDGRPVTERDLPPSAQNAIPPRKAGSRGGSEQAGR